MSKLIYAADDEENIRELIKMFLEDAGYKVQIFPDGDSLLEIFAEIPADMVILDVMMPGRDGIKICDELRKISKVPIIILTAKDTEFDFIRGITVGSDDYIIKPFRPTMLLMKIKSIFRRIEMEHNKNTEISDINIAGLIISSKVRSAFYQNQDLKLTGTEFALLSYLAKYYKQAVNREALLKDVWGYETDVETRVVDETIRRLRNKMKDIGCSLKIETVWGYGYKMV